MIFILPVIMNNDILIQYKKYRARNARFILILIILLALIGLIALMAGSHTISWHELWALIKGEGVEINRQIVYRGFWQLSSPVLSFQYRELLCKLSCVIHWLPLTP